jgi:hypothetical protein
VSNGPTWFSWFTVPIFAPLSGAVTQRIAPIFGRGDAEIEADVCLNVGSYGRQLGIVSEAVDALAKRLDALAPDDPDSRFARVADDPNDPVRRLHRMVEQVTAIKERHRASAKGEALRALERLKAVDPDAYETVAAELRPKDP